MHASPLLVSEQLPWGTELSAQETERSLLPRLRAQGASSAN